MKLHSLISAVVLSMAAHVQAQEKPVPTAPNPAPAGGGGAPQTVPAPKAETTDPGAGSPTNRASLFSRVAAKPRRTITDNITLTGRKLGDAVAEIENHLWNTQDVDGSAKQEPLPNIIFSADSRDAAMPGSLRIQGVSPVQTLALACAAAGCAMEAIFAPAEDTALPGKSQQVIGYRIARESAKTRSPSPIPKQMIQEQYERNQIGFPVRTSVASSALLEVTELLGITLSKKDDGVVVETIVPGSPVSTYAEIKPGQRILGVAELGRQTVDTTSIEIEKLVALLRGTPGTSVNVTFDIGSDKGPKKHTVQLVRAGLPIPSPNVTALGVGIGILPGMDSSGVPIPGSGIPDANYPLRGNSGTMLSLPMDNERQTVHVHALGNVLGGSNEESARKQALCQELIAATLHQAELNSKTSPSLSFHRDSRVLVVKATAAQHEMIGQVIKALKENEIQPVQKADALKEKPSELTPEGIKPPGI